MDYQEKLKVYYQDRVFYEKYIDNYLSRITNKKNTKAFTTYLNNTKNHLEIYNIIDLADQINKKESVYGMQNINANNEKFLYQKTYKLTKSYNELWDSSNLLIKEIFLLKKLIDISPFLINNDLIFNLIISANLINNNYPPILIDDDLLEVIKKETDYFIIKENLIKYLDSEYSNILKLYEKTYKV